MAVLGPLAQLVEQGTLNPKVVGSIPTRPISQIAVVKGDLIPPVRAPGPFTAPSGNSRSVGHGRVRGLRPWPTCGWPSSCRYGRPAPGLRRLVRTLATASRATNQGSRTRLARSSKPDGYLRGSYRSPREGHTWGALMGEICQCIPVVIRGGAPVLWRETGAVFGAGPCPDLILVPREGLGPTHDQSSHRSGTVGGRAHPGNAIALRGRVGGRPRPGMPRVSSRACALRRTACSSRTRIPPDRPRREVHARCADRVR